MKYPGPGPGKRNPLWDVLTERMAAVVPDPDVLIAPVVVRYAPRVDPV